MEWSVWNGWHEMVGLEWLWCERRKGKEPPFLIWIWFGIGFTGQPKQEGPCEKERKENGKSKHKVTTQYGHPCLACQKANDLDVVSV